jgi:anti-sigma B factor antagonist
MSVKLTRRQVGDAAVIDASGGLLSVKSRTRYATRCATSQPAGNRKILLNPGDVSCLDSTGIGELVAGFTSAVKAGGTVKLPNPTKRVKDLLRMTNLNTIFDFPCA